MKKKLFALLLFGIFGTSFSQSFDVVPLGVLGGEKEDNLSSYLVSSADSDAYLALDAGTLHAGIEKSIKTGALHSRLSDVLTRQIKGYFISHAHLDHVSGLILNSPTDSSKPIYAIGSVLSVLENRYFQWDSWANFTNKGDRPTGKYTMEELVPDAQWTDLKDTNMQARVFILSHGKNYQSSAILLRHGQDYVLYLGDTGADSVEKSDRLDKLWTEVAPLIDQKTLKGIFIEVSFANSQPKDKLFGHLTPELLGQELQSLAQKTQQKSLGDMPIIITHNKPSDNGVRIIKKELLSQNQAKTHYIFPKQGRRMEL